MNRFIGKPSILIFILVCCMHLSSCANKIMYAPAVRSDSPPASKTKDPEIVMELRKRAEMERRFGYRIGAGLVESSLLEKSGEYGEAVFSAYKDIAYARSYGAIEQAAIEERLEACLGMESSQARSISRSVEAIRAFNLKSWQACVALMEKYEVPDSFSNWMLLAAQMRITPANESLRSDYAGIQSRYALFPEYWYFSMLQEIDPDLARDAAERCIKLAPLGPRSLEARNAIAVSYGLDQKTGASLLIAAEIESIATNAMVQGNPELLRGLFPVLALSDNPSTLYALGVLKGLCDNAPVQAWVRAEAKKTDKRLAERLRYAGGAS